MTPTKRLLILALLVLLPLAAYTQSVSPTTQATNTFNSNALGSTVTNIKTSPGNLWGMSAFNGHAAACFIQVFDALAANVVLGTTAPTFVLPVAGTAISNVFPTIPIRNFKVAISVASTTTATGSTACTTTTVVTFTYK